MARAEESGDTFEARGLRTPGEGGPAGGGSTHPPWFDEGGSMRKMEGLGIDPTRVASALFRALFRVVPDHNLLILLPDNRRERAVS